MSITIKKESEYITYIRKTTEHTLEVNDKQVRVYAWIIDSDEETDNGFDIDENDVKDLTEEELDGLNYYLTEALELKVGAEYKISE